MSEPKLQKSTYKKYDVPILGQIAAPGTVEGGMPTCLARPLSRRLYVTF
ncbi:hypothetical protein [Sediminicola luteus]|uniref:Lasso RiPP family leader peptide-containing protein n=1 Tax=Sediminicola luteus TaxID=319238 RepID=A0ABV2TWE4_9FLAO